MVLDELDGPDRAGADGRWPVDAGARRGGVERRRARVRRRRLQVRRRRSRTTSPRPRALTDAAVRRRTSSSPPVAAGDPQASPRTSRELERSEAGAARRAALATTTRTTRSSTLLVARAGRRRVVHVRPPGARGRRAPARRGHRGLGHGDERRRGAGRGRAGADVLVVQGVEAGGHRGTFDDAGGGHRAARAAPARPRGGRPAARRRPAASRPAPGSPRSSPRARAAAQLGTAFMLCPEAATTHAQRETLGTDRADRPDARVHRAPRARHRQPLPGRAQRLGAPSAYPEIHHVTAPLRAAARQAGDAESFNLWAGQAHALTRAVPAAQLVRAARRRGARGARRCEALGRRMTEQRQHPAGRGGRRSATCATGSPTATTCSLDRLLSAQQPVSDPPHHDELLFIIQHQTSELWLKLVLHELVAAQAAARRRRPAPRAQAPGPRQAHPAHADRAVVGARDADAGRVRRVPRRARAGVGLPVVPVPRGGVRARQQEPRHAHACSATTRPRRRSSPTCSSARASTTSSCATSPATGTRSRRRCSTATSPRRTRSRPSSSRSSARIYEDAHAHWEAYEACEELIDLEENFQLWRFRHLKTVERTIGAKRGTGGSSGTAFLRAALDLTFFPELLAVRTEIGT